MAVKQIVRHECTCEKCSHTWETRNDVLPAICPACKSRLWNGKAEPNAIDTAAVPIAIAAGNVWKDPIGKGNACHDCGVIEGKEHKRRCGKYR